MKKIDLSAVTKINRIIAHDNLNSSYKLALLKATIITIEKYDHFIKKTFHQVEIPFFFVLEEWFFYLFSFRLGECDSAKEQK